MSRRPSKRKKSAFKLKLIYLVGGVMTAGIIGLLILIQSGGGCQVPYEELVTEVTVPQVAAPERLPERQPDGDKPSTGTSVPETSTPARDPKPETTRTSVTPSAPPEKPPVVPEGKGRIYIVIDDVGHNIQDLRYLLKFPGKLTFAVLPDLAYTEQSIELLKSSHKTVIIHQPMAPENPNINPGDWALYPGMSKKEVWDILDRNFKENPDALGLNNHMGSKATADPQLMSYVMEYLQLHNKVFLDSWTTPGGKSVAYQTALDFNISATKRNSVFLDNQKNREAILSALTSGLDISQKKGHAVMIGHAVTNELVDVLIELYPKLIDEGYSFHDISDMFLLGDFR